MGKGKLLFKGDKPKKKKSKSKHSSKTGDESSSLSLSQTANPETILSPPAAAASAANSKNEVSLTTVSSATPTIRKGTGKITTSGTVVTGHDTRFEKELANGDAIMCIVNGQEELRVITMRLSNASLNLSSAFSTSLATPTNFQYIRQPRDHHKESKARKKKELETKQEREQHAYDLYRSEELVYREKTTTGSYRIRKETVQGGMSRGNLLDLRTKKTSDKYC